MGEFVSVEAHGAVAVVRERPRRACHRARAGRWRRGGHREHARRSPEDGDDLSARPPARRPRNANHQGQWRRWQTHADGRGY